MILIIFYYYYYYCCQVQPGLGLGRLVFILLFSLPARESQFTTLWRNRRLVKTWISFQFVNFNMWQGFLYWCSTLEEVIEIPVLCLANRFLDFITGTLTVLKWDSAFHAPEKLDTKWMNVKHDTRRRNYVETYVLVALHCLNGAGVIWAYFGKVRALHRVRRKFRRLDSLTVHA